MQLLNCFQQLTGFLWESKIHGLLVSAILMLSLTGCPKPNVEPEQPKSTQRRAPDPLTVLVIDDSEISEPLKRQWLAETNGELKIVQRSLTELTQADFVLGSDIDIVIYPVGILGDLESRKQIIPLAGQAWQSQEYNKDELLRIFRSIIPRHRNEIWGVPLGGATLTLVYDQAVFDSKTIEVPQTWKKLLEFVAQARLQPDTEFSFRLPLAKGWAAELFLARSASMIRTRGRLSTVFERSDMTPLIDTEPFQIALQDLKTLMGNDSSQLDLTPAALFYELRSGKTKMGITWPPSPETSDEAKAAETNQGQAGLEAGSHLAFASLPGGEEWYDPRAERWNLRTGEEARQCDLVGFHGLLASVTSSSRNTADAFDFLIWVGNKSTPLKTLSYSRQSGPFRASHLANPSIWFTKQLGDEEALRYADVLALHHDRDVVFMFPRIPGRQQYLEVLDHQIRACLRGELEAEAALKSVAKEWEAITETWGRKKMIGELKKDGGL